MGIKKGVLLPETLLHAQYAVKSGMVIWSSVGVAFMYQTVMMIYSNPVIE